MITYDQIREANAAIRMTDVKGKEYAEVNQRIMAFRMVYPFGFIETDMVSNEDGVCVFKAWVGDNGEDGKRTVLGTGTAYEREGSTYINKTSYIENCETSAVGRALGMAGFGIATSVASAEEVQNAIANQNREEKATPKQVEILSRFYIGENRDKLLSLNGVDRLEDLPLAKASDLIKRLRATRTDADG